MVPRCRALRSHSRLDCFANIHNWNLIMYAVREQRIVPSMMVNLSASLGFIILNFRPVVNRLLYLLTTRRLLWFGSRRQRGQSWLGRASRIGIGSFCCRNVKSRFFRSICRRGSLFRHLIVLHDGKNSRYNRIKRSCMIMLLVMTIHVVLRRVMVRFMYFLCVLCSSIFLVSYNLGSLGHQMATNVLKRRISRYLFYQTKLLSFYFQGFQLRPHFSDLLFNFPPRNSPLIRILVHGF